MPGLYVHVPFCSRRCPYCDFYSISSLELIPDWLEALAIEARAAAPHWGDFDTLFLGGGSPSLLSAEGLQGLKKSLAPLDFSKAVELSLEANPEDISLDAARRWADWGFTRVSLGVQSFDDRWLSTSLMRGHQAADVIRAAEHIKEAGLELAVDLIYGNPGQESPDWAADLSKAAGLEPAHISTYCLTVEPTTALARSIAEKYLPPPPPQETLAEMFLISRELLIQRGFERYEVSNFARPGHECRHNLKYWRREPYLGLGPAAHSFDGERRWGNVRSLRRWMRALKSNLPPQEFSESVSPDAVRLEALMLGLRLREGFPESLVVQPDKIAAFVSSGHLLQKDGRLASTEKGLLIADRLALELG